MHRSTSALLAAFFVSVTVCLVGPVQAEIITEPTDLSVGEQYRLVFVTSGSRDATSTDIEDYNSFVDGHGDFAIASDWKVIGSTSSVDARDNTSSNPNADGAGVPLYNLAGERVANDYADLWDGDLINAIGTNEYGDYSTESGTAPYRVWTGSRHSGVGWEDNELGGVDDSTKFGYFHMADGYWNAYSGTDQTRELRLYGMSEMFTVGSSQAVPEPAALLLALVGLALLPRKRRR